jgi:hypothetical protein
VAPDVIVDESGRRSDEAVRRLREESRRRIERGRAAGPSRCMLGIFLAMLVFVALESRRAHWAQTAGAAAARDARAAVVPAPTAPALDKSASGRRHRTCLGVTQRPRQYQRAVQPDRQEGE